MSTPNRCFESIVALEIGGWRIRVWRTEEFENTTTFDDIHNYAVEITRRIVTENFDVSRGMLLTEISALPHVAAVEVTGDSGFGCIVYPDWH